MIHSYKKIINLDIKLISYTFYKLGTFQRRHHHLLVVVTGTARTDPVQDIRMVIAHVRYTPTQRTRCIRRIHTSTRWINS